MKKAVPNTQTLIRAFTVIAKRIDKIEKDNYYLKIVIAAMIVISIGVYSSGFFISNSNSHSATSLIVQNGKGNSIARIEFDDSGHPILSIDGENGEPPLRFAMTDEGSTALRQRAGNEVYADTGPANEPSSTMSLSEDRLDFSRMFSFSLLADKSWTNTYDTNDRKQASTVKNRDGSIWKTFQFSYTGHDLLTSIVVLNATGEFDEQWQFSYDEAGNRIEIDRCDDDEIVLEKWIRTSGPGGNENAWKPVLD